MSGVTKIDGNLLPLVDAALEKVLDNWGQKKWKTRKAFVSEAVKEKLLDSGITPEVPA